LNRFLFRLAKTWLGGLILHWIFAYFSFAVPGEKLIKTDVLLAFHHPAPSYPLHILIVPRKKYRSLQDLPSDDFKFEMELFKTINDLAIRFELDKQGYRLIANGGGNQEADHLHFHLISGEF